MALVGMYDHRMDKWQYLKKKKHQMAYGVMFAVETAMSGK